MPSVDPFEVTVEQIVALFGEMQSTSDRVAAVSCCAWMDDSLSVALSTCFIKMGKEWHERLFDNANAPLGTFSAKILLGYALGLYGSLTRADLDILRRIHNRFAHTATPVSFTDPDNAADCRNLTTPGRISVGIGTAFPIEDPPGPKALYVRTAQHVSLTLIREARAGPGRTVSPSPLP